MNVEKLNEKYVGKTVADLKAEGMNIMDDYDEYRPEILEKKVTKVRCCGDIFTAVVDKFWDGKILFDKEGTPKLFAMVGDLSNTDLFKGIYIMPGHDSVVMIDTNADFDYASVGIR